MKLYIIVGILGMMIVAVCAGRSNGRYDPPDYQDMWDWLDHRPSNNQPAPRTRRDFRITRMEDYAQSPLSNLFKRKTVKIIERNPRPPAPTSNYGEPSSTTNQD